MENLNIEKDELHLWYAFPEAISDPGLLARYHALLNEPEGVQQRRFHFERHRHQYLITRALVRTVLARYLGYSPAELVFEKNEYGRPELTASQRKLPIHFNLSHTEGLIVCGVALGRELGVDVEDITRGGDLVQIADRFFSPPEVKDLHTVPGVRQEDRFFDYWTLKEAYIKARGMGLSIPLEQFSYHLSDEHQDISISIDPRQQDQASRWIFRQWRHGTRYKIAVCLEHLGQSPLRVSSREVVPFGLEKAVEAKCFRSSAGWLE